MYPTKSYPLHRAPITFLGLLLALLCGSGAALAQDVAETIRVDTRVVFLDALVKDKRTGVPISDLKPENFEVLDENNPRAISYFTREGQARKPLALVLILDLREDGAGRFLRRPEVLKTMADELAKLSPQDEVAVLAMNIGEDEQRVWLAGFTHDPAQLVAALSRAPEFIAHPDSAEARAKKDTPANKPNSSDSLNIGSASTANSSSPSEPKADAAARNAGPAKTDDDVVETEIVKGKNGSTVVRKTRKNGLVDVKRVNKSGKVTVELGDIYDMAAAVKDTTKKIQSERPDSQAAIVWVSDGITPIFFEDRDATEQLVLRSNVIFSSLTVEMRTLFKFLMPIGKPIAGMLGMSVYGAAKRLAQQSGGEAVKVSRTKDYATGLSRIIGNLTARYSLGFTLQENEKDDGRLHSLEVRVKAKDAKGKTRKLEVSARRGYYMTETREKEAKNASVTAQ
ncbi:MAG TPA: VWA domain-containing protein [Pyrinomonadaceae bacterium]|jgi:VWFA-related protein|nr:VWA domain-containing protein [Pyrinomonadaceae bacterium]